MLRHLKKGQQVIEPRFTRNLISQVVARNRFDGRHFDFARRKRIATANLNMWAFPDSNAHRDFAALYSRAKTFRKLHREASVMNIAIRPVEGVGCLEVLPN